MLLFLILLRRILPLVPLVPRLFLRPKRKASTYGAASSHVAKCTRSALSQSSGSTTRPSLFVGDDDESDDDNACVEIPLVTPLRSASMIGGSSVAPAAEGSNTRDSLSKGVMVDDAAAPFTGDGVAGNCEFTRGELLARYRGLSQSHHEYMLSTDSRLKGYEEKAANMTGLELQVSALKKQVSGLNDQLSSSDASFAKSKAKGKERKKKIKSFTKSLDNLHTEVPPNVQGDTYCFPKQTSYYHA
ncbi:hypothetical protein Tco_0398279 [Tanacetum coccineum]